MQGASHLHHYGLAPLVPCCSDSEHVINFSNPDFLSTILSDLNNNKFVLQKAVQPATVIDSLALVLGSGYIHRAVRTMSDTTAVIAGQATLGRSGSTAAVDMH
jgi:hypothetical protein